MRSSPPRSSRGLLLACLLAAPAAAFPPGDPFVPLQAELTRSLSRLKTESFGPPYFLAYRLTDLDTYDAAASFGSLVSESRDELRILYAEVRVGSRALDNTDLSFNGWSMPAGRGEGALRQGLWLLTDRAYKSAVSGYLEKKAKRAVEYEQETLDDFTAEAAAAGESAAPAGWDSAPLAALLERVSAVFSDYGFLYDSRATLQLRPGRRALLTSEGGRLLSAESALPGTLILSAMTRAPDGMRLDASKVLRFKDPKALPSEDELKALARGLASDLLRLRESPVQAPAGAPAILDGEVAGVLFHEALGHKLEGQRQRDPRQSQLFKERVGSRILPEFLTLVDDPTLESHEGQPLSGTYRFDSEGIPARRVTLVERGTLKSFLMSRWPVKGFSVSNGHGRSEPTRHPTGRMANLILSAENPLPAAALKARLLELCRKAGKPYGFRLVGSFGGENPSTRDSAQTLEVVPRLVYRVDAKTGAETLVRGVKMVGTPLTALNRVAAAGNDPSVGHGYCGAESGRVPVSQVAPSLLLTEVELQRLPEDRQVPPLLPSPLHDRP